MSSLTEEESVNPEAQIHIYEKQNLTRDLEDEKPNRIEHWCSGLIVCKK